MTPATRFAIGLTLAATALSGTAVRGRQEAQGEIFGKVAEANDGRSVPGITVTIDGRRLTGPQTAVTDATGYRFANLAAGTYFVRVSEPGFRPVTRENLVVPATGGRIEANLALTLSYTHDSGGGQIVSKEYQDAVRSLKPGEVVVGLDVYGGGIVIAVDTRHAPVTSANFLKYVDEGFYNLGRFHRVTRPDNYTPAPPNRPAMEIIQGGPDPFRFREAHPPIPLERTNVTGLKHVRGTVSMARGGPDTATSDFFICLDDQPSLDFGGKRFDDGQGAAAFGRVIYGMDTVRRIQQSNPVRKDNPQYLEMPVPIVWASAARLKK